jgi:hypothetical protein
MKLQTGFDRKRSRFAEWCAAHNLGRGAALLFAVLVSLSAIASVNFDSASSKIFLSGDIATGDIVADYGFVVKDNRTTERHRAQTRSMQPLICDLMPATSSTRSATACKPFLPRLTHPHPPKPRSRCGPLLRSK